MKKITLMAALLGSAYFANAQVGIGTPTPNASAMLDITATNKGVLIPRVALEVNDDQTTVATPTTSLLVYNTNTSDANVPDVKKVTPGFYYWNVDKWERIVNQSQLDTAITNVTNLQGDVTKIKALLDAAYGSNNLGDTATSDSFGGMVFTPAVGNPGDANYESPKFEYVVWDSTSNSYERLGITSVITDLINASETKTTIVTIDNVQYYLSESFNKFAELAAATTDTSKLDVLNSATANSWIKIDVVGGVINNIEEIFTTNTTIVINEGEINQQTFTTVQEYIEYISQNSKQDGETKIVYDVDGNVVFQTWDSATNAWVDVDNVKFSKIVKDNETKTTLARSVNAGDYTPITADPKAATKVTYEYSAEGGVKNYIDVTADIVTSITNNTDVQNAISNVLNAGGNVYYGDHDNSPTTPDVFYTIDAGGNKVAIQISQVVVNAITNATTIQKQEIKNQLGDTYSTTNVVKTGDTWVDGKAIFKSVIETTVLAGTANITGANPTTAGFVTIVGDVSDINVIGIRIIGENGVSASATDLSVDGKNIHFRIGTGSMYNVLSANDLTVKVLVEFSANTTTP